MGGKRLSSGAEASGGTLIPPLENGDRLTRDEFERRWEAMPHIKSAELIEGTVHMPSPVRLDHHGHPHALLQGWTFCYEAATPGVQAADNTSVRLDLDNMPQPDTILRILAECGGQAVVDTDGYLAGGPELAAEVAASSASIDLHAKFHVYRRNMVREYIVWRVLDKAVDWFVLRGGKYELLPKESDGYFHSEVFPGLWLDPAALVNRQANRVVEVLQQGLMTEAHALFVERLNHTA